MLASATTPSRPGYRSAAAAVTPPTARKSSRRPPMSKKSPYAPSGKSTAKAAARERLLRLGQRSAAAAVTPPTARKSSRRPPMSKKSPYAPSGKSTAKPSSAETAAGRSVAAPTKSSLRSDDAHEASSFTEAPTTRSILKPSKWRATADASLAKPLNVPDGLSEKEKGACIMFIINPVWWKTHGEAVRSIAQRLTWNESDVDFKFNDNPREYYLEDKDRNYPRRVQIDYNHEMNSGFKLARKKQQEVWKACGAKVDAMKQHGDLPAHLVTLLDDVWEWGIPEDLAAFKAACDEHLATLEAAAAHLRDNEETVEPEETEANVENKTPSSANVPAPCSRALRDNEDTAEPEEIETNVETKTPFSANLPATSSLAVDRKKAFKRGIDAEAKRLGRREVALSRQKASRAARVAKTRAESTEPATSNSSAAGKQHRVALGDCTNNASRASTATASASASMRKSPDTRSFPDSTRAKGVVGMGTACGKMLLALAKGVVGMGTACGKRKGGQLPSLSAKKRRTEPTSSEKSGRSQRKSEPSDHDDVPPGKRSRSGTAAQKSGRSKRMNESPDHDDVPPGKRSRSDTNPAPKQNPVAVAQRPAAPVDGVNAVAAPAAVAPAAAPAAAPMENEAAPELEEPVEFGDGGDDAFGDNLDDGDAHDVAEREVQPVEAYQMLLQLDTQRRERKKARMLKELECTLDGPYWRR